MTRTTIERMSLAHTKKSYRRWLNHRQLKESQMSPYGHTAAASDEYLYTGRASVPVHQAGEALRPERSALQHG